MLLLPGLMCDTRIWAPQLAAFPDAVAVPDYPGCRSLQEMARHALTLAPARFALVGHSMGARVALEVWRAAPERVTRIALLDTGVHMPRPNEAEGRHKLLNLGRTEGIEALMQAWLPPMVAPANRANAAMMAELEQMVRDAGVDQFEDQITALLGRPNQEEVLPTITVPALVGVGSLDIWSPPAQHEAIAAQIPDAELVIFEGAGHMAPVETPDQVNQALAAWLNA